MNKPMQRVFYREVRRFEAVDAAGATFTIVERQLRHASIARQAEPPTRVEGEASLYYLPSSAEVVYEVEPDTFESHAGGSRYQRVR